MRQRFTILALVLVCVLALANLAAARTEPGIGVEFDPDKVERIECYYFEHATRLSEDPVPRAEPHESHTDPGMIRVWCDVLSTLYARELPYAQMNDEQQAWARTHIFECYRFVMKDGSAEEFYFGNPYLRVGDRWYYVVCGEEYDYWSVNDALQKWGFWSEGKAS